MQIIIEWMCDLSRSSFEVAAITTCVITGTVTGIVYFIMWVQQERPNVR